MSDWENFYTGLYTIATEVNNVINILIFFVRINFLKSIALSILMINLFKILDAKNKKAWKYGLLVIYLVYTFVSFFPSDLARIEYMQWYEMLLFVPYLAAIIFGGLIKFSEFGRRFFNYYTLFAYYLIINVVWLALFPGDGIWWIVLLYSLFLFVLANCQGALLNEQADIPYE